MALTRKFLSALGIEADKIEEIITAHTETVDALKEQRDTYKADAEKLPEVQKELTKLKADTEGQDSWKLKYDAVKEEFDTYKNEQKAKETEAAKRTAYKQLLKDTGVSEKRLDAVLRVSKLDDIKLDKDGKIVDSNKVADAIKEEWADFISTEGTKGAETATPPNNSGSKMSKEEILKIKDTSARQKAMAENHELFGF